MSVGEKQIQLIDYVKNFLKNLESSNIKPNLSSICYFTSWAETPGYARLKLRLNGWSYLLKFCTILLKNCLSIATHTSYIEISNPSLLGKRDILVLSWCFKKNFQPDGSLQDRYFLENSKDLPNSHWLLVSMDGYVPPNLNNNITIIKKKRSIFKYNFFSFAKILIRTIFYYRFSLKKIFHYLYFHSHFAKQISSIVKKELKKNNYKIFLLPYEAQPFQLTAILEAKKFNKEIKTIGYIHTVLTPNPCDYIHRLGSPDLLMVHGESNLEILKSKLDWPKNKLVLTQSFRYRLDKNRSLSQLIFTPYTIHNSKIFLNEFKKLLIKSPVNSFPNFDIKIHPPMSWLQEVKHFIFRKKLKKLMEIYKDRFSNTPINKNIAIFFGVTAAIFEALETGIDVIHVCSDPVFDSHSAQIWPNLKVEQLSKNVFSYTLISRGKYIVFGDKKNILNLVLKKL
jgi:hypothetical protein